VFARFNAIIQHDIAIQYKVELAANGFVAHPDSTLPTSTSLRMLMEQQDAWRRCQWTEVPVPHSDQFLIDWCPFQCRESFLALARDESPVGADFQVPIATAITCVAVASAASKSPGEENPDWCLDKLGVSFRGFAIDPTIDLLVLVEEPTDL